MAFIENTEGKDLIKDLILLVEKTKLQVVSYANRSLTVLFWHIGNRILSGKLENKRAEYGKLIVVTVSRELVTKFGRNYEEKKSKKDDTVC